MSDHDRLCRNKNWTPWTEGARCPVCDEYARVRADERSYSRTAAAAWREAAEVRERLRGQVQALHTVLHDDSSSRSGALVEWVRRDAVLALLGGESDAQ